MMLKIKVSNLFSWLANQVKILQFKKRMLTLNKLLLQNKYDIRRMIMDKSVKVLNSVREWVKLHDAVLFFICVLFQISIT